jgi:hypothetical protein
MDSKTFREVALSYAAVYNQNLREEIEQKQDFENWVDSLVDEGYDLSNCTWEELYEAYVDEERAPGVKAYRPNPTQAEVRADAAKAAQKKSASAKGQSGYGPDEKFKDWKDRSTPASTLKRKGGETETVSQRMNREKPYGKRMTGQMAREYGSRHAAEVTRVVKGAGEPQAVTYPRQKSKVSKEIIRKEQVDVYDIILSHLLDEGYASTPEAAKNIMVNMSEDWIESILG